MLLVNYYSILDYWKSLDDFTYRDSYINSIILSCMSNVSLTGVSGRISFGQGADPIKDVSISRIQGKKLLMLL